MIEKIDRAIDHCWQIALENEDAARPADVRELFLERYPETADHYREQMFRSGLMRKINERAKLASQPLPEAYRQSTLFKHIPGQRIQRMIPIASGADSSWVAIEKATREHVSAWLGVERLNKDAALKKFHDTEDKVKFFLAIMHGTDTVGEALARYRDAA